MSTEVRETSAMRFRRLTAPAIANAREFPLRMSWADDPIVARIDVDAEGLRFLLDCLEAHAPTDGATGEMQAVMDRVLAMLEATDD